ncbi:MAG: hypothetical protein JJ863_33740 [Deltaproteobacteria bacterium]|nr:hypothetical protein [Deltaproteobacteria bacterium]
MSKKTLSTALIAFALGCAAAPLVVPPLSAQQQAAGVQRWENTCVTVRSVDAAAHAGMSMGAQGWEMVSVAGAAACFKRPL